MQLARASAGFKKIRGVHRAFRLARAHERVRARR